MAKTTNIEWCDATFNPWMGCTKVSRQDTGGGGCDHCYAEHETPVRVHRGQGRELWGAGAPRVRTSPANWRQPERWNAEPFLTCTKCGWRGTGAELEQQDCCKVHHITGARRRVFCASLADVFDNEVPVQWRRDLFDLIAATPNLDWLLLTKRIGNASRMIAEAQGDTLPISKWAAWPLPNVWLGATIVNQKEADRDIPKLLATPARVRFLSMEPLLGPVDLTQVDDGHAHRDVPREEWGSMDDDDSPPGLWWNVLSGERTIMHGGATGDWSRTDASVDWVIVGGESGPKARPMHPGWVRSLRDQCAAAGVPFLFKQWGEYRPAATVTEATLHPVITTNRDVAATTPEARSFRPASGCHHMEHQVAGMLDGSGEYAKLDCAMFKAGKKAAGRLLDGAEHNGFPKVNT
ncbi:MAG: phage Gp37/Gp68 family protein [Proteobacteria bacterium]|nr:phage Gp37/Gp68 family protein [Pseudomonadota bacterium]